jgi:hypothetical protein
VYYDSLHSSTRSYIFHQLFDVYAVWFYENTLLRHLVFVVLYRGGRSGYPKFSGRIIRVFKISGFEN